MVQIKITSKVSEPGQPPVTRTSDLGSSVKRPLKMQGSTSERVASTSIGIGLYLLREAVRFSLPIWMERRGIPSKDVSLSQLNFAFDWLSGWGSSAASEIEMRLG